MDFSFKCPTSLCNQPKISLSVQKDNYAVKLYRKAGFTTVKETTEEYIMVADLNSICKMEEENGF